MPDCVPLRQALKDLGRAYTNFFLKRSEFPKFRKKGQRESFRVPQGFEVDNGNQTAENRSAALPQIAGGVGCS
ncbi:MAG: hypothetical protein AUF67_05605 [Acidobacteria bacterium 13_1_20CM_58_21]|nr:MAG: hypothetical protein AUF67_05605 [Acidobacteria bacterium 13_1_20CM_58_21]